MAKEIGADLEIEKATQVGDFAMFWYSIGMLIPSPPTVAVIAGTILPYLASRDVRLLSREEDEDEDTDLARIRETVRTWMAEAKRQGKQLKLPVRPFMLRNSIWTVALALYAVVMLSTFFINAVWQVSKIVFFFLRSVFEKERGGWMDLNFLFWGTL